MFGLTTLVQLEELIQILLCNVVGVVGVPLTLYQVVQCEIEFWLGRSQERVLALVRFY